MLRAVPAYPSAPAIRIQPHLFPNPEYVPHPILANPTMPSQITLTASEGSSQYLQSWKTSSSAFCPTSRSKTKSARAMRSECTTSPPPLWVVVDACVSVWVGEQSRC